MISFLQIKYYLEKIYILFRSPILLREKYGAGWIKQPRDSIQFSTHPSTKICAINLLTSQELEHKPEASQEFLRYDMDLQVPEGTDFSQFAVAGM